MFNFPYLGTFKKKQKETLKFNISIITVNVVISKSIGPFITEATPRSMRN